MSDVRTKSLPENLVLGLRVLNPWESGLLPNAAKLFTKDGLGRTTLGKSYLCKNFRGLEASLHLHPASGLGEERLTELVNMKSQVSLDSSVALRCC